MTFPLGYKAFVVAAGARAHQPVRLNAVIVLLPYDPPAPAASPQWLADWPSRAHALLDSLSHVGATPRGADQIQRWPIEVHKSQLDLDYINALWVRIMAATPDDWGTLLAHWSGRRLARSDAPTLPLPTGHAGLAIPLERARAALEALAEPNSPLLARAPTRPPPSALAALGRPWLGEPSTLERYAALEGHTLSDTDHRRLYGPPDVGEWLAAQWAHDHDAARPGSHAYARPLDPEELAREAIGQDGRDMLATFDRIHALHHAAVNGTTPLAQPPPEAPAQPTQTPAQRHALRRLGQLMASPSLMRLFGLARDVVLLPPSTLLEGDSFWELQAFSSGAPLPGAPTAAKLALPVGDAPRGFYPCPRAEWPGACSAIERDGLVILGGLNHAIITLEPVLAIESGDRAQKLGRDEPLTGEAIATPHSGSLALVRFGADDPAPQPGRLRFSEDLRNADRLDVGVVIEGGSTVWRCVQNRRVVWLDPTEHTPQLEESALRGERPGTLERALRNLTAVAALHRHELDAANSRRLKIEPKPAGQDGPRLPLLCQDERLAGYDGTPGGAAANEPRWDAPNRRFTWAAKKDHVTPDRGLPLGQYISLPSATHAPDSRLPPLRFGWRYRMGLRRVWLGGVTRPLAEAATLYQHDAAACIPPPAAEGHLYLRHEPIAAPLVALPASVPPLRPNSPHEDTLQTAEGMVVISWPGAPPQGHRAVRSTARVLLVPPVSLEFAVLHGMFDDDARLDASTIHLTSPPSQALTPVNGELPRPEPGTEHELRIRVPRDMRRRLHLTGRIDSSSTTHAQQAARAGEPLRLDILSSDDAAPRRKAPYYPDPAASFLAVGLREATGDEWARSPRLIRLRSGDGALPEHRWPNPLPVQVELVTGAPGERTLDVSTSPSWLPSTPQAATPTGTHIQTVTVRLGRGESVTLEAWLVPSLDDIADWFDICGTAAQLARMEGRAHAPQTATPAEQCRSGLMSLLGTAACAPLVGAGGLEDDARHQVASLLWAKLIQQPVEGISKVRSISLLHAYREPAYAPAPGDEPLSLTRRLDISPAGVATFLAGGAADRGDEDGAIQAVVSGSVTLDLATTSGVLIEAVLAAPDGDLDAPRPKNDPALVPLQVPAPRALDDAGAAKPEALRTVPLLRIDGIPAPTGSAPRVQSVDVGALQRAFVNGGTPGLKPTILSRLANGGARRVVELRATPLPRHAAILTPAGDALPPSPPPRRVAGPMWLNATMPPTAPDPKELLPTFEWHSTAPPPGSTLPRVWTATRRVGLRLTLRPPAFSSGEGEEVGVIIWTEPDEATRAALAEEDIGPLGPFASAWARDPMRDPEPGGAPRDFLLGREHFDVGSAIATTWEDLALVPMAGGNLAKGLAEEDTAIILRLKPRRDPGEGVWFVDIPFRDSALRHLTDRFIRLGVVAWQPHARPDRGSGPGRRGIRCSATATSPWAVLPPRRQVTVTALDGGSGITLLTVRLAGPGDAERSRAQPATAVRISVLHAEGTTEQTIFEAADAAGQRLRPDTVPPPLGERASPVIVGLDPNGDRTWIATFRLRVRAGSTLRGYAVLIEEMDAMPDAERDTNPGDELVAGGMRCFARIDLT